MTAQFSQLHGSALEAASRHRHEIRQRTDRGKVAFAVGLHGNSEQPLQVLLLHCQVHSHILHLGQSNESELGLGWRFIISREFESAYKVSLYDPYGRV